MLLSVSGPASMTLHEVNQAATKVAEHCTPDANVIFGATIDDSMGDEMRVTVIAAGFGGAATERPRFQAATPDLGSPRAGRPTRPEPDTEPEPFDDLEIPDFLRG